MANLWTGYIHYLPSSRPDYRWYHRELYRSCLGMAVDAVAQRYYLRGFTSHVLLLPPRNTF
jgi:hypothetical protein